jgi:hypothetical protein
MHGGMPLGTTGADGVTAGEHLMVGAHLRLCCFLPVLIVLWCGWSMVQSVTMPYACAFHHCAFIMVGGGQLLQMSHCGIWFIIGVCAVFMLVDQVMSNSSMQQFGSMLHSVIHNGWTSLLQQIAVNGIIWPYAQQPAVASASATELGQDQNTCSAAPGAKQPSCSPTTVVCQSYSSIAVIYIPGMLKMLRRKTSPVL